MGRAKKYKEPSLEELKAEAEKHTTKGAFQAAAPRLYGYAYRNGLLPEICDHMYDARARWTEESLQAEAAKYTTRSEFAKNSNRAYQAARDAGLLDKICAHMERKRFDTIYISKEPGTNLYKVGLTSRRLGLNRIACVKPATELVAYVCFKPPVGAIERDLLRIGTVHHGEYRIWTDDDLRTAIRRLAEYM